MTDSVRRASAYLGYPEPFQFFGRTAYLAGSALCATIAARVFAPSLNLKSHFIFGQVTVLTFSLIFLNAKIRVAVPDHKNPLKRKIVHIAWGLSYTTIPMIFSKVIVSRYVEPLSLLRSFVRGFYYTIFNVASFYVYHRHLREQRK